MLYLMLVRVAGGPTDVTGPTRRGTAACDPRPSRATPPTTPARQATVVVPRAASGGRELAGREVPLPASGRAVRRHRVRPRDLPAGDGERVGPGGRLPVELRSLTPQGGGAAAWLRLPGDT